MLDLAAFALFALALAFALCACADLNAAYQAPRYRASVRRRHLGGAFMGAAFATVCLSASAVLALA